MASPAIAARNGSNPPPIDATAVSVTPAHVSALATARGERASASSPSVARRDLVDECRPGVVVGIDTRQEIPRQLRILQLE